MGCRLPMAPIGLAQLMRFPSEPAALRLLKRLRRGPPLQMNMNKLIALLACVVCVSAARADFTSYTLVSQTDPLTYLPKVTFTYDTLSINFTGNTPPGLENVVTDTSASAEDDAIVTLDFTSTKSIVGDSVQLAWYYPDSATVYEYFPSILVPGTVFAGSGAGDFTIGADTVTIVNTTSGWSPGSFNGFVITDLTRAAGGPPGVPDTASTLLMLSAAVTGLAFCSRKLSFLRR